MVKRRRAKKEVILHPSFYMITIDPAAEIFEPGRAQPSDSGRALPKPFPPAPVFRMTLVGTPQLPQTTTN